MELKCENNCPCWGLVVDLAEVLLTLINSKVEVTVFSITLNLLTAALNVLVCRSYRKLLVDSDNFSFEIQKFTIVNNYFE